MKHPLLKIIITIFIIITITAQPILMVEANSSRDKLQSKYKWDLTVIYPTETEWEKDTKLLKEELYPKIAGFKGKLDNKINTLTCFKACNEAYRVRDKIYNYAWFNFDIDQSVPAAQELFGRAALLRQEFEVVTSFIYPELAGKSDTVLKGYLNDPDFNEYKSDIYYVLTNKHNISMEKSSILSLATALTTTPSNTRSMLTVDIENTGLSYSDLGNTFAALLNAEVNKNIFLARVDKHNSALEASLNKKNIPLSVYENLITSADKGLEATHKFQSFNTNQNQRGISYEKAQEMVLNALTPLGEEYCILMQTAFNDNWIDVYPTPNKKGGGYCSYFADPHPFILINYYNTFNSASTLAHELGHAAHIYYSADSPPTLFTTEVASIVNEILLCKYMIDNAQTDNEKIVYINELLNIYTGAFFHQVMYAEFEKLIYEKVEAGNTLTLETLNDLYLDLLRKYYGENVASSNANGWMEITHFYKNFYVFQYATGVVAASQLSFDISENKSGALETYLEFLHSGGRYDSVTTILNTGVDITSPQTVDNFVEEYVSLVNELEQLLIPRTRGQQLVNIFVIVLPCTIALMTTFMVLLVYEQKSLLRNKVMQEKYGHNSP